jgi:hypothetical protein
VADQDLTRWAAKLAPAAAIEATIAWLDAGQPDRSRAAARIRHVVMAVVEAAATTDTDVSFPDLRPTPNGADG